MVKLQTLFFTITGLGRSGTKSVQASHIGGPSSIKSNIGYHGSKQSSNFGTGHGMGFGSSVHHPAAWSSWSG